MKHDLWTLSKVDIRAPVAATGWPVARVELHHAQRGRLTDVASAPGALEGAFAAVSQIMDVPARVDSLELQYVADDPEEAAADRPAATSLVHITIAAGSGIFTGRASDRDVLTACLSAYVDAASKVRAARAGHEPGRRKVDAQ